MIHGLPFASLSVIADVDSDTLAARVCAEPKYQRPPAPPRYFLLRVAASSGTHTRLPTTPYPFNFQGHRGAATVRDLAVSPDRQRMVTGSSSKTVRLWDLKKGVVSNKLEGHRDHVSKLAVSRDGQIIASGDIRGNIIAWHGQTGTSLTLTYQSPLHHNPDVEFFTRWNGAGHWFSKGNNIEAVEYENLAASMEIQSSFMMQSGAFSIPLPANLLAIATSRNIEIYYPGTRERVAKFEGHEKMNFSLAWTHDGTRLLSGGDKEDPSIREWDAFTW
ncbi:WD40-repeat-containing domain protein [Suillus ampliporus]|nr:WD40-repeat-containing domain protein [Suillus ampliporus]